MKKIDLRRISRRSDVVQTTVLIFEEFQKHEWIVFGEANISLHGDTHILKAYGPKGWTDFEHDSIYVLKLPLVGLHLDSMMVSYHQTHLTGWIASTEDDFRIPAENYDVDKVAKPCKECEDHHMMVPEGYYVPKKNKNLFEAMRGKKVSIIIGNT